MTTLVKQLKFKFTFWSHTSAIWKIIRKIYFSARSIFHFKTKNNQRAQKCSMKAKTLYYSF